MVFIALIIIFAKHQVCPIILTSNSPVDPPKAPGKPTITDYDNTSVTLQWEPPSDNGGRPILGYVVEMKDKFSPDWIEVNSHIHRKIYFNGSFIFFINISKFKSYYQPIIKKLYETNNPL